MNEIELAVKLQDLFFSGWVLSVECAVGQTPVILGAINESLGKRVTFNDHQEFLDWVNDINVEEEEDKDSFMLFTDDMYTNGEGFEVHSTVVDIYDTIHFSIPHTGILEMNREKKNRELGEVYTFTDPKLEGYSYVMGRKLVVLTVPLENGTYDIYLTYSALGQINEELLKLRNEWDNTPPQE